MVMKIDSLIESRLNEQNKIDSSRTFDGQIKVYKNILGIKFRKRKGIYYERYIRYDEKPFYEQDVSIFKKCYGSYIQSSEYYFIDGELAKFISYLSKRNRDIDMIKIKDSSLIYFQNGKVISSVSNNKISDKKIETILDMASEIVNPD